MASCPGWTAQCFLEQGQGTSKEVALGSRQVANFIGFSWSFWGVALPSGDKGLSPKGGRAAGPDTTGTMNQVVYRVSGC